MHLGSIRILVQDSSDWVWRNVRTRTMNASPITLRAPLGICAEVGTLVFRMVSRVGRGPCTEGKDLCDFDGAGAASSGTMLGV